VLAGSLRLQDDSVAAASREEIVIASSLLCVITILHLGNIPNMQKRLHHTKAEPKRAGCINCHLQYTEFLDEYSPSAESVRLGLE
jgi:hypothetical protein